WHIPETHYLETWSDACGHDGLPSIIQPLIAPLYNGRWAHEVIGALIGGLDQTPYQTVREHWAAATPDFSDATWRKWLHDGFIPAAPPPSPTPIPPRLLHRRPPTANRRRVRASSSSCVTIRLFTTAVSRTTA